MADAPLHVVQATAWYLPHSVGGTEMYLAGLVEGLDTLGITSTVLTPRVPQAPASYMHAGTRVATYPINFAPTPAEVRARLGVTDMGAFRRCLAEHEGAIYHQHAWAGGCSLEHLQAARDLGLKTVLTIHVPGNICLRGTMLRFGVTPCDGVVDAKKCGACFAESRGVPVVAAQGLGYLPLAVANLARRFPFRIGRAAAARSWGEEKVVEFQSMIACANRIVAVCGWLYDALRANGVPEEKLVLSRQGVSAAGAPLPSPSREPGGPLRFVYLGRCYPIKGIDVIVRAVRALPMDAPVQLTLIASAASDADKQYERELKRLAEGDCRIRFADPVPHSEVPRILSAYDAIVVPSVCLETGPLVVLEAQAAGLFVLGSRLGGIAEIVDEQDGGELITAGDVDAWAQALKRSIERHAAGGLPRPRRPVRRMVDVAQDMAQLYRAL